MVCCNHLNMDSIQCPQKQIIPGCDGYAKVVKLIIAINKTTVNNIVKITQHNAQYIPMICSLCLSVEEYLWMVSKLKTRSNGYRTSQKCELYVTYDPYLRLTVVYQKKLKSFAMIFTKMEVKNLIKLKNWVFSKFREMNAQLINHTSLETNANKEEMESMNLEVEPTAIELA